MFYNLKKHISKAMSAIMLSAAIFSNLPLANVSAASADFGVYTIQIADNNTLTLTVGENGLNAKVSKGIATLAENTVFVPLISGSGSPNTLDDFSIESSNAENDVRLKAYNSETMTLTFEIGTAEYSLELFSYGNVNKDSIVSIADCLQIISMLNNVGNLSAKSMSAADVNGDHIVSIKDSAIIVNHIDNKTQFPVETSAVKNGSPVQASSLRSCYYIDSDGNESEYYVGNIPEDSFVIEAIPSKSNPKTYEEFYVDFQIKNNPGFAGYGFTLEFDPDIIEPITDKDFDFYNEAAEVKYSNFPRENVAVYPDDVRTAVSRIENGKVSFSGLNISSGLAIAENDGVMFRIPFKAKAEIGSTVITLRAYNGDLLINKDAETIPAYTKSAFITVREPVKVTGITLNKTKANVAKGTSVKLTADVTPNNADYKTITWQSSNPDVASVNNRGDVTGIAEGTAVITATTNDGEYSAQCTVTVKSYDKLYYDENASPEGVDSIPDNEPCIEVVPSKSSLTVGDEFYVDFKIKNNPGFVAYDISVNYNPDVVQPFAGNVEEMDNATEVRYDFNSYTTMPAIDPVVINNSINRANSDPFHYFQCAGLCLTTGQLATASNNGTMFRVYFKTVGEGSSDICIGGAYDYEEFLISETLENIPIYVQNSTVEAKTLKITDITLNKTETEMSAGTFLILSAETVPENAPNENIVWSSSDPSVASVYSDGAVLAHKQGTAVITAETENGDVSAQCAVTVTDTASIPGVHDLGDVDQDGHITAKDAAYVLKKALDSSFEYPVETNK